MSLGENGKDFNKSWDGLWDGKARITDKGWEGELITPFRTLGFSPEVYETRVKVKYTIRF